MLSSEPGSQADFLLRIATCGKNVRPDCLGSLVDSAVPRFKRKSACEPLIQS
jgi:hypothetical protein